MSSEVASQAAIHSQAYYNHLAPRYDKADASFERHVKRYRQKLWAKVHEGSILEVGIGTGKNIPYYPDRIRVTGIDFAEKMLECADKRAHELGKSIELHTGDVQALTFPDNSFDMAVSTFVFCVVADPVQGLRELNRVVKPGGRIFMLEHVRVDLPVIGFMMDVLNPLLLHYIGANINRRTAENAKLAGLRIESVENLDFMQMMKLIVAQPGK